MGGARIYSTKKRLVPVVWRPVSQEKLPSEITDRNYIFFTNLQYPNAPIETLFKQGLEHLLNAIKVDVDWVREHTRIVGLAEHWDASCRPEAQLLRSDEISNAAAWLEKRKSSCPEIPELLHEFLEASRKFETQSRDMMRRVSGRAFVKPAEQAIADGFYDRALRLVAAGVFAAQDPELVLRVYRQLKLNLPRRVKRRIQRARVPLEITAAVNASWSLDFMYDSLYSGKRFRTLNVIDEGVRECLAIEVDTSLRAERVVKVLERLKGWRGTPRMIRLDNGPELTSVQLQAWCESNGVELKFIQPGKPNQNAFIERFNRTFRSEVLNAYLFESLEQVREVAWWWMVAYNEERPHDALKGLPPSLFRKRLEAETSTFELST